MFPPIRDISPVINFDRFFEMDSNVDARVRTGPLVNPRIAGICQKYVHLFDMHLYQLLTYVIMPDHMHIILTPEMLVDHPDQWPWYYHTKKEGRA